MLWRHFTRVQIIRDKSLRVGSARSNSDLYRESWFTTPIYIIPFIPYPGEPSLPIYDIIVTAWMIVLDSIDSHFIDFIDVILDILGLINFSKFWYWYCYFILSINYCNQVIIIIHF